MRIVRIYSTQSDPVKISANEHIEFVGDKIYDALPHKMKDSLEKHQIT